MSVDYDVTAPSLQEANLLSNQLWHRLHTFVSPLLLTLDALIDVRLVRTFLATLAAILKHRHKNHGLLLSELGAHLLDPAHAPAATKRLSNLLRCTKWESSLIDAFLWQQAQQFLQQLQEAQRDALVLWDESVLEKPESLDREDLCPVRSSKAKRLMRVKPGYYNPPTKKPIFVPGMAWIALILLGRSGPPCLAAMRWWSSRGKNKTSAREEQEALLQKVASAWGREVMHVFDRGYAGGPWLQLLIEKNLRGIVRWPNRWCLHTPSGEKHKAWEMGRGKRTVEYRMIWDATRRIERKMGIWWCEVRHPQHQETPLWLVASRPGKGLSPWYLLTTEPVTSSEEAWKILFAYARRWQIEMVFRYSKSELAFESPRLWSWENREKLLLMATLVYAFLLGLLAESLLAVREWLLRYGCHRTGKRSQQASAPLYRLRVALSNLWHEHLRSPANDFLVRTLHLSTGLSTVQESPRHATA